MKLHVLPTCDDWLFIEGVGKNPNGICKKLISVRIRCLVKVIVEEESVTRYELKELTYLCPYPIFISI